MRERRSAPIAAAAAQQPRTSQPPSTSLAVFHTEYTACTAAKPGPLQQGAVLGSQQIAEFERGGWDFRCRTQYAPPFWLGKYCFRGRKKILPQNSGIAQREACGTQAVAACRCVRAEAEAADREGGGVGTALSRCLAMADGWHERHRVVRVRGFVSTQCAAAHSGRAPRGRR